MFDEGAAAKMLDTWGPKVLKMIGFGETERVACMDGLAFLVEKAAEVARRAETHQKQLSSVLAEQVHQREMLARIEAQLAAPVKKPSGHKGA